VLSNENCAFNGKCECLGKIYENGGRPVITHRGALLPFTKAGAAAVSFSIQQVMSAWAN
jgi:hypothetical protein